MPRDHRFLATADWTANTLLGPIRPDSRTTFLSHSRAHSDNPSLPDSGNSASPSGLGIARKLVPPPAPCDVSFVSRDGGSTAGHQPSGQAEQATCPSYMHCDIYQHQQPQSQAQLDFPQHQQHEQPSPSAQQSSEASGSTQTSVVECPVQESLRCTDSPPPPYAANTATTINFDDILLPVDFPQHQQHEQPFPSAQQSSEASGSTQTSVVEWPVQESLLCTDKPPPPYAANTATTINFDNMSLLDGMAPHAFQDDSNYDGIVPSFDSDLLFTRMDEQLDSAWAPDSHAQCAAQERAAHEVAHRVPTASEDSHTTSTDAADAGTALSSGSTSRAARKADDRRTSARRGISSREKSTGTAKRRRHEANYQPIPREQTARQLRHNEMERQRRAAVLKELQQLAQKLDFVAKQPPRTEVLVATALTIAQRDPQACFSMLRKPPSKEQLKSMRTQRDVPQLTGEEYLNQKQLTADIVNVIKIAMRAKTGKLPLKYPFTSDGQEQSTLYPGRGWIERFNAELQVIQEYNSTNVTQPVSVDQCHAYCLLQFPAIDLKSLDKKRNPQQPKSKQKHNVNERERRLYNKFLLVLVQHLCSARDLSEMDSLCAARARVFAALDGSPEPSPYGDFLEFKHAHTGSKNSEQGAGTA